jgi:hypothetical protein
MDRSPVAATHHLDNNQRIKMSEAPINPTHVHDLVANFRAVLLDQVSRFRQKRDSLNQVPLFVEAVQSELARYENKIATLRSNNRAAWSGLKPYDANWDRSKHSHVGDLLDLVETQIRGMAESEIAKAEKSGFVEFSAVVDALRDTGKSSSKLKTRKGK